jgi:hypothetical protein
MLASGQACADDDGFTSNYWAFQLTAVSVRLEYHFQQKGIF